MKKLQFNREAGRNDEPTPKLSLDEEFPAG